MSFRELTDEELALVAGGSSQVGKIIAAPPPKEPEIPPLPGLLPGVL